MSRVTKYSLPAAWALAITRDDFSRMTMDDASALGKWLGIVKPGTFIRIDPASGPFFDLHHEARMVAPACECLVYEFYKAKK